MVAPDREDWWYTVSDQVDGERVMPVFINTLKNIFSYGVSKYDKKLADTMRFSVTEVPKHLEWCWASVMWEAGNGAYKRRG